MASMACQHLILWEHWVTRFFLCEVWVSLNKSSGCARMFRSPYLGIRLCHCHIIRFFRLSRQFQLGRLCHLLQLHQIWIYHHLWKTKCVRNWQQFGGIFYDVSNICCNEYYKYIFTSENYLQRKFISGCLMLTNPVLFAVKHSFQCFVQSQKIDIKQ